MSEIFSELGTVYCAVCFVRWMTWVTDSAAPDRTFVFYVFGWPVTFVIEFWCGARAEIRRLREQEEESKEEDDES